MGGEVRAIVLPEEDTDTDTGEERKDFAGEDACNNEKHAGRLARLRVFFAFVAVACFSSSHSLSEWRSTSLSKASPEEKLISE